MDETLLMNAGLTTSGVAILLIVYRVFKTIQGKKLVSSCCGRRVEVGLDVVPMTPVVVVENPSLAVKHGGTSKSGAPAEPMTRSILV